MKARSTKASRSSKKVFYVSDGHTIERVKGTQGTRLYTSIDSYFKDQGFRIEPSYFREGYDKVIISFGKGDIESGESRAVRDLYEIEMRKNTKNTKEKKLETPEKIRTIYNAYKKKYKNVTFVTPEFSAAELKEAKRYILEEVKQYIRNKSKKSQALIKAIALMNFEDNVNELMKEIKKSIQYQTPKKSKGKRLKRPRGRASSRKVASPSSKKSEAKRFKRPCGRAPGGKEWDYTIGKWKHVK